jgi:DNA repair protein RecN (Recombination protein N)
VFDEVDAGIGGEAAAAVGTALRDIARHHQVLVVTHLAQVAANATAHLRVLKQVQKGQTFAGVEELQGDQRVSEVARMLSGEPDEAARAHAKSLLQSRQEGKRTPR